MKQNWLSFKAFDVTQGVDLRLDNTLPSESRALQRWNLELRVNRDSFLLAVLCDTTTSLVAFFDVQLLDSRCMLASISSSFSIMHQF